MNNAPVYIAPCPDYDEANCAAAIEAIAAQTPVLRDIRPGTRVAIKANLVTMMKPDKAATTHPALLKALTAWLQARGAEVTVGDAPGGTFTKGYLDGVYAASGMKQTGAAVNQNFDVKHVDFPEAAVLKDFEYTAWLDEADLLINFCKLKSHGMMALSCAVKNMFGAIPGFTKPAYHYRFPDHDQFADMLVDLNEYFKPQLQLVDAVIGMEGNGPTMGTPRHIGAVMASESPYTLDLVCAKLIGLAPEQVPTVRAAIRRALCPTTAEGVTVVGELAPFLTPDFQAPSVNPTIVEFMGGEKPIAKFVNSLAAKHLPVRPVLTKTQCVSCAKCAGLCPAKAITMRRKHPVIDRDKCIRCFCCQEFCPVGALKAQRSAFGEFVLKHTQK